MAKKVLLIGLDPKLVDYDSLPTKLDEPTLRKALDNDERKLRELGYDASWLLVDRGETAESVAKAKLETDSYDCVLIGAGIRTVEPLFPLFEKLVNAVHASAPRAKIAMNSNPNDTPEAVQRWA